ncbi:MAG: hypothetical protein CVT64_10665 [Actinobacteria bacterium HGW-Actinobacteria-4]|nr:MAG: hypothetical protein CVT64_10665 [Actinobacteria bacterium HGW-Actinobacteria-4]
MSANGTPDKQTVNREPLATNVTYTSGMLGRPQPGMLVFDGVDTVTLIADDGAVVFSKSTSTLGRVRRAEYALYFKGEGKTIAVMFGNALTYMAASGSLLQFGVVGAVLADRNAKGHTKASGMDEWESALKATGNMGFNASSGNITKYLLYYPAIGIGVIGAIAVVIALVTR